MLGHVARLMTLNVIVHRFERIIPQVGAEVTASTVHCFVIIGFRFRLRLGPRLRLWLGLRLRLRIHGTFECFPNGSWKGSMALGVGLGPSTGITEWFGELIRDNRDCG